MFEIYHIGFPREGDLIREINECLYVSNRTTLSIAVCQSLGRFGQTKGLDGSGVLA